MDLSQWTAAAWDWLRATVASLEFPDLGGVAAALPSPGEMTARIFALELPVPDVALLSAFFLVLVAISISQRGRAQDRHAQLERLYQSELLTANRRTHQANGELRKAKMEIERSRQKQRRLSAEQGRRTARPAVRTEPALRVAAQR